MHPTTWPATPARSGADVVVRRRDRARVGHGPRRWLSTTHPLWLEAIVLIGVYVTYDAGRGLAAGGRSLAVRHGRSVAHLEQRLHLFLEPHIQQATSHVPLLQGFLGFGYSTFHLGVTLVVLGWLYRRHKEVFAQARTALLLATGLALVGFTAFPAAPPRLANVGVADTLSLGHATASSGFLRLLYNPYAAMPSVHVAFAVLVGSWMARYGRRRWIKALGCGYPFYVAGEVVITGNHFVLDVAAGVLVAVLAGVLAARLVTNGRVRQAQEERTHGLSRNRETVGGMSSPRYRLKTRRVVSQALSENSS